MAGQSRVRIPPGAPRTRASLRVATPDGELGRGRRVVPTEHNGAPAGSLLQPVAGAGGERNTRVDRSVRRAKGVARREAGPRPSAGVGHYRSKARHLHGKQETQETAAIAPGRRRRRVGRHTENFFEGVALHEHSRISGRISESFGQNRPVLRLWSTSLGMRDMCQNPSAASAASRSRSPDHAPLFSWPRSRRARTRHPPRPARTASYRASRASAPRAAWIAGPRLGRVVCLCGRRRARERTLCPKATRQKSRWAGSSWSSETQ